MADQHDEIDKLTDHEYDGIQEFDNKLPGWWLTGFYFTIFFGVVYLLIYHVFSIGPSSEEEYRAEMFNAFRKHNPDAYLARVTGAKAAKKTYTLLTKASDLNAGKAIFEDPARQCVVCHKADMGGVIGPNLTDDYWLNGFGVESLMNNIRNGFLEKGMMPYGNNIRMTDKQLNQVVSYIISMRGTNPAEPKPVDTERARLYTQTEIDSILAINQ